MQAKVLGVLSGRDMPLSLIRRWAESADRVFAADGGANVLLMAGVEPDAVVGDLDSIGNRQDLGDREVRLIPVPDQLTTDCDKLLAFARQEGYREITLASVEGDRLDHMIATIQSAARAEIGVRLALRNGIGWILKAGDAVSAETRAGRIVSLLPITPTEAVSLEGVQWPLANERLSPLEGSSVSNRAIAGQVDARIGSGAALLYVELPPEEAPLW